MASKSSNQDLMLKWHLLVGKRVTFTKERERERSKVKEKESLEEGGCERFVLAGFVPDDLVSAKLGLARRVFKKTLRIKEKINRNLNPLPFGV